MADIDYWLGRKYALLQQQADATTKNADTGAMAAVAQARLQNTQADLAPAESKAQIGQTKANTNLLTQQASVVVPESRARIANLNAQTDFTGTQNTALYNTDVRTFAPSESSLARTLGQRLPTLGTTSPYRLSNGDVPPKRPGESELAYQTRIGQ